MDECGKLPHCTIEVSTGGASAVRRQDAWVTVRPWRLLPFLTVRIALLVTAPEDARVDWQGSAAVPGAQVGERMLP